MKKILIFSILMMLCFIISAQNEDSKHGPHINFSNIIYDYDTIVKGSDGVCAFEFVNDGIEPLIITSAFSSCGCTVPSWPEKPILPKGKGFINVKYSTAKTGTFQKAIVVKSNSATNPQVTLRIKGVVVDSTQFAKHKEHRIILIPRDRDMFDDLPR